MKSLINTLSKIKNISTQQVITCADDVVLVIISMKELECTFNKMKGALKKQYIRFQTNSVICDLDIVNTCRVVTSVNDENNYTEKRMSKRNKAMGWLNRILTSKQSLKRNENEVIHYSNKASCILGI